MIPSYPALLSTKRWLLIDHLELARAHVADGEELIALQTELLSELMRRGHPTDEAEKVLWSLVELHAMNLADCKRIEQELATANPE